ncbi:hypothetical protein PIB30_027436 [Stylosanthes scabra]|uniref:Uncharacterized protein n=1 Tax=Stylosanthes scabra TaxID=79078 RepID=A0ABU6XCC1_9FABA|nr:hypothetical protein [Stylosanthes scabra]
MSSTRREIGQAGYRRSIRIQRNAITNELKSHLETIAEEEGSLTPRDRGRPKRKERPVKETINISSSNHGSLKTNNNRHDKVNSPNNYYLVKESETAFTSVVEKMTSAISSLAKILESQSSSSARFFTPKSITSTLNTKSTPGSSPNILTGDMNVIIKKLFQVNEDTIEHHINKKSNNDHENSESEAIM